MELILSEETFAASVSASLELSSAVFSVDGETQILPGCVRGVPVKRGGDSVTFSGKVKYKTPTDWPSGERQLLRLIGKAPMEGVLTMTEADGGTLTFSKAVVTASNVSYSGAAVVADWSVVAGGTVSSSDLGTDGANGTDVGLAASMGGTVFGSFNDEMALSAVGVGISEAVEQLPGCDASPVKRGDGTAAFSGRVQYKNLSDERDAERKIMRLLEAGRLSGVFKLEETDGGNFVSFADAVATPGNVFYRGALVTASWSVVAGGDVVRSVADEAGATYANALLFHDGDSFLFNNGDRILFHDGSVN
jgi:hypothetical protein